MQLQLQSAGAPNKILTTRFCENDLHEVPGDKSWSCATWHLGYLWLNMEIPRTCQQLCFKVRHVLAPIQVHLGKSLTIFATEHSRRM